MQSLVLSILDTHLFLTFLFSTGRPTDYIDNSLTEPLINENVISFSIETSDLNNFFRLPLSVNIDVGTGTSSCDKRLRISTSHEFACKPSSD